MAAIAVINAIELTSGTGRSLNAYNTTSLVDRSRAFTVVESDDDKFYFHYLDKTSTETSNPPFVIVPLTGPGRWILTSSPYGDLAVMPKVVSGLPVEGGISGGDITRTSDHVLTISPISCLSSDLTTQLYASTSETITIPTVANTIYHIFRVKLVADGSMEYRAYTTEAAVASDTQVSKYRWIGFWKTNGSSNCVEGLLSGDCFAFLKSSEAVFVSGFTSTSYLLLNLTSVIPVSRVCEIYFGVTSTDVDTNTIHFSIDGTYPVTTVMGYTYISDTVTPWGYSLNGFAHRQIPVKNGVVYAKTSAGTINLGIAQVKIRR